MHFFVRDLMPAKGENDFKAHIPSHIEYSLVSVGYDSGLDTEVSRVFNGIVCPEILRPRSMVDICKVGQVGAADDQQADYPFCSGIQKIRSYPCIDQRIRQRRQFIIQGAIYIILRPIMLYPDRKVG